MLYWEVSKLHIPDASVTWFKGKVLNQGLRSFRRAPDFEPLT